MSEKKIFNRDFYNLFFYFVGVVVLLFLFILIVSSIWIGYSVKEKCQWAQDNYEGDCVEALSALLADENIDFEKKNSAVWALGQLGDEVALPVLEDYYNSSEILDKCDRSEVVCNYELEKAIKLINSGFNISAFIWR